MERKLSSKSFKKGHSSKKKAERTSRRTKKSKEKLSKIILSCEETSSDESVNIDESRNEQVQLHSCVTVGECSESVGKLERELSSKSHEKGHPSKKNVEGTSRRTKKSKEKSSKRIPSSEETSSDESVNTDESRNEQAQLYSSATAGEGRESVGKLKIRVQKESISKQNVEASSSKGKAFKRITSREKHFSGKMMKVGSSRIGPYSIHSRGCSEDNNHIEASKKLKKPSSSKSLEKIDLTKKSVEATLHRTERSRNKSIDYCEDNSTEESSNDVNPPTSSNDSATDVDNGSKKWQNYKPLPPVKKTENDFYKQTDSGHQLTYGFGPSIRNKSDASDDRLDTDKFSEKSSTSEVLPDCGNLFKSGSSSPFSAWGKFTSAIRHSKADEKLEKDGAGVEDGSCSRKDPKQSDKDWQRFRYLKMQQDKREKQSSSQTDASEPQPQKDAFKSFTPMVNSKVDMKRKNDDTKAAGNTFSENSPKEVNDILKKEGEKTKDLTSRTKIGDAEDSGKMPSYGGSNENITDLKSSPETVENKTKIDDTKNPDKMPSYGGSNENITDLKSSLITAENKTKIDDAKDPDKMPSYGGSNENITDLKSSPITAKNKGDPSNVLKENRPRPSI